MTGVFDATTGEIETLLSSRLAAEVWEVLVCEIGGGVANFGCKATGET